MWEVPEGAHALSHIHTHTINKKIKRRYRLRAWMHTHTENKCVIYNTPQRACSTTHCTIYIPIRSISANKHPQMNLTHSPIIQVCIVSLHKCWLKLHHEQIFNEASC